MTINHADMVRALVKPGSAILDNLSAERADLWHGATGVAGEGGELLEGVYLNRNDYVLRRENLLEESGDLYFYVEQIIQRTGIVLNWERIYGVIVSLVNEGGKSETQLAIQIAVVASQVLDTVKKFVVYNKELDCVALTNQLSDLCIYIGVIGIAHDITRQQALKANIAKLGKRYESLRYSDNAAQARADKAG